MSVQVPLFEKANSKVDKAASRVEEVLGPDFDVQRRFIENFKLLTEATGAVDRLRELVLELAMRGRLTPQGPGESLPSFITDSTSEGAFELPSNWAWVPLSCCARLDMGKTPPTKAAVYWSDGSGGYPWVSIGDMVHFGEVVATSRRVSDLASSEVFRGRLVPKGTLLMSFKLTIGKVALLGCDAFHNEAIVSIFPHAPEMRDYLFRTLPLLTRLGVSKAAVKGATLNRESLEALMVPIPPLAEQKRIVAKVDQLMALCDDLEARQTRKREVGTRLTKAALEALATAEGPEEFDTAWRRIVANFATIIDRAEKVPFVKKSILELAVRGRLVRPEPKDVPAANLLAGVAKAKAGISGSPGGTARSDAEPPSEDGRPFDVPVGWEWARVGDTFDVAGGIQKTPHRAPVANHYPYLRVENVQRGRLDLGRLERFELQPGELEKKRLVAGDLLVVEGNGSENEIGRCALWDGSIENCVHQNHIIRCRPLGPMWSPFVLLFLNSPSGMAEMKQLAITTSGLYSLSVGKIRGIFIPIPPLAEQKRIVAKVEQLTKICDDLEANLRRAEDRAARLVEAVVHELVT